MIYSVKQLAKELSKELYDIKNHAIVCEHADGTRHNIIDVRLEADAKEVVLVADEVKIQEDDDSRR